MRNSVASLLRKCAADEYARGSKEYRAIYREMKNLWNSTPRNKRYAIRQELLQRLGK